MRTHTHTNPKATNNGSTFDYERVRSNKPKLSKLAILLIGIISVLSLVVFAQNAGKFFPQNVNGSPVVSNNPSGIINQIFGGSKNIDVPSGTRLNVNLQTSLNSGLSRSGDLVTATVTSPIVIGSDTIIPTGSRLKGHVVSSTPARRFRAGDPGSLGFRFTELQTPNGKNYPISTSYSIKGGTGGTRLAKGITKTAIGAGAGALLGTAIGAIAGGMPGRGAWSGAAIGGGVGATTAIISKGSEAVLNNGTNLTLVMEQSFRAVAYNR